MSAFNPICFDPSQASPWQPVTSSGWNIAGNVARNGTVSGSWQSPVLPVQGAPVFGASLNTSGPLTGTLFMDVSTDPGVGIYLQGLSVSGADRYNVTGSSVNGFIPPGGFYNWTPVASASVPGSPDGTAVRVIAAGDPAHVVRFRFVAASGSVGPAKQVLSFLSKPGGGGY